MSDADNSFDQIEYKKNIKKHLSYSLDIQNSNCIRIQNIFKIQERTKKRRNKKNTPTPQKNFLIQV